LGEIPKYMTDHAPLVSAVAAVVAILFSIFVFFRTRWLHKKTERPMLMPGTLGYSSSEIFIGLRNSGGHPAEDLRIKYGTAPLSGPEQYKLVQDRTFVNKIGIGGETTIFLQRGARGPKLLKKHEESADTSSND
jgi:hypothetical protein